MYRWEIYYYKLQNNGLQSMGIIFMPLKSNALDIKMFVRQGDPQKIHGTIFCKFLKQWYAFPLIVHYL